MTGNFRLQIPASCFWLRLASLMVPTNARAAWRCRHETSLQDLLILDDRGELAGDGSFLLAWLCRDAMANAFRIRLGGWDPVKWLRSPASLLAAATAAVLLIAVCTHGFEITRSLVRAFSDRGTAANANRLVAYLFPLAFAIATGVMAAKGRLSLRGRSKIYCSFLLLKTLLLGTLLCLVWIEGGAALRACISNATLRVLGGGLAFAIVFIATFAWAVMWSFADQQHRCPVCLRRLVQPVSIGSWASVFDPATTEWICEAGHGSLCMNEIDAGDAHHWIEVEPEPASVRDNSSRTC